MKTMYRAALVLGLVLFAGTAHADSKSAAAADLLFQQGRELFSQEKYAEASDRFLRSNQLDPAVGTLLNLGDCYKRLGKSASAVAAYRDAGTLAKSRADDKRLAVAEDEVRQLEPKLARLRIVIGAATQGATLLLNGEPVDPSKFASPTPVDPGEETLEASAPGRKSWFVTVQAEAGTIKTITVPALESRSPGNPLATGLEIGGGIALGAALTFGAIAMFKWSSVEDACPEQRCPTRRALNEQSGAANTAQILAHASTVTAIVGAAALGLGLYLDLGTSKRVAVGVDGPTVALRARWP